MLMKWLKQLFKKKPVQHTFCYCPSCNNELCGSNSFVEDTDFVYYKCSKCGEESKWDFDTWMVPLIVDENGNPLPINFGPKNKPI